MIKVVRISHINRYLRLPFVCTFFMAFLIDNPSKAQVTTSATDKYNRYVADSLLIRLKTASEDTNKVNLLNALTFRLTRIQEFKEALSYCKQSLELAQKLKFKRGEIQSYKNFADVYSNTGKVDEALETWQHLQQLYDQAGYPNAVGGCLREIGNIYMSKGKTDEAFSCFSKALKIWEQSGYKDGVAWMNQNIGAYYQSKGMIAEALAYYHKALAYWEIVFEDFEKGQASSLYSTIGNIHLAQGNYKEAEKYFFKNLAVGQETKKFVAQITSNMDLGTYYYLQGIYPEALKYYFTALRYAEDYKRPAFIAEVQNCIGDLYTSLNDFDNASKYLDSALKIRENSRNYYTVIKIHCSLGSMYAHQSKYKEAMAHLTKAQTVAEQFQDKDGIILSSKSFGNFLFNQANDLIAKNIYKDSASKMLNNAFQVLSRANKITKEQNLKSDRAQIEISMGSVLNRQAMVSEKDQKKLTTLAIEYLESGLSLAKDIKNRELERQAYGELAQSNKLLKNYSTAFHYMSLYSETKDSPINTEANKKIEQYRIKYEVDKKESQDNARAEKQKTEMQLAFRLREDSIKYEKQIADEKLKQQTLFATQQQQALRLKQVSLDLANKENSLNQLNFTNSQLELEAEQTRLKEKENQLSISEKVKSLQANNLLLKESQLQLKEKQLDVQAKEKKFYMGGAVLISTLFISLFIIIRNRQKSKELLTAQQSRLDKANALHKMTELELQSLRAQLNPHFMFNSLNAIQDLIFKQDHENSHVYLSRFSRLLRMLLENANLSFIPLQKELEILELYLTLEKLRIPDLNYSIEIEEGIDPQKTLTPNMMLQPYIENAVWHGLSHKQKDKKIKIYVQKENDTILFRVSDNGIGRQKAEEIKRAANKIYESKGMELLSKRFTLLSQQYGEQIEIKINDLLNDNDAAGTEVQIKLPLSLSQQINAKYNDTYAYN